MSAEHSRRIVENHTAVLFVPLTEFCGIVEPRRCQTIEVRQNIGARNDLGPEGDIGIGLQDHFGSTFLLEDGFMRVGMPCGRDDVDHGGPREHMSLDEMTNYCKTMRTKGTNMKKL